MLADTDTPDMVALTSASPSWRPFIAAERPLPVTATMEPSAVCQVIGSFARDGSGTAARV
jgi:hypothetical protein